MYQDPKFVDQNNLNFRLQSASPAINAGVDVNIADRLRRELCAARRDRMTLEL